MKEGGETKVISERGNSFYIMRVRAFLSKRRNGITYNRKTSMVYSGVLGICAASFFWTSGS